ncbi:39S ribosomal protein L45, mitochondrial [Blyttiomyces sp. JEL0837]|nr:39S ribosomal protein L45, mitochondrial [Blyttiomyces sp. JEL0837]
MMRARPVAMNILDPWLPPHFSNVTERFTANGRKITWEQTKKFAMQLMTMYELRKRKITTKDFKLEAERLYVLLNQGIARLVQTRTIASFRLFLTLMNSCDKEMLERAATQSFAALLNPELKRIKKIGRGEWKQFEKPRLNIVNMVSARVQNEKGPKDKQSLYCQITVKVKSKQSYALYSGRQLVGGDPNTPVDMTEYLVYERNVADPTSEWRIAGKIATSK